MLYPNCTDQSLLYNLLYVTRTRSQRGCVSQALRYVLTIADEFGLHDQTRCHLTSSCEDFLHASILHSCLHLAAHVNVLQLDGSTALLCIVLSAHGAAVHVVSLLAV